MLFNEIQQEKDRLSTELEKIDKIQKGITETEIESLQLVIDFSELCKMASELYKSAFDTEKRELVNLMFSELVVKNGKQANYRAKPAFERLLQRHTEKELKKATSKQKTAFDGGLEFNFGSVKFTFSELWEITKEIKPILALLESKVKTIDSRIAI